MAQRFQDPKYAAEVPRTLRGMVACKVCGLVKNYNQFYDSGCDNCGEDEGSILARQESAEQVDSLTTPHFEGLMAVMNPDESWAARWQGVNKLKPGVYALKILEDLADDIKTELISSKIPYRRTEDELFGVEDES